MRARGIQPGSWWQRIRRAFVEFLSIPLAVVVAFLLLAAGMYVVDEAWSKTGTEHSAVQGWLGKLFGDSGTASNLLSTIASSLITVTSITFSLLLLAVQQGATTFGNQVFDQFLRRRANQFHFGFFVGLSAYSLVTLATINGPHHPVFGTLAAVMLTVAALCMMVLLIYSTVDQMRGVVVVRAIHDHTLRARERQMDLLVRTRRSRRVGLDAAHLIRADRNGVVARFDLRAITVAVMRAGDAGDIGAEEALEVVLCTGIGVYVAYHDALAEIRSRRPLSRESTSTLARAVRNAIKIGEERDLDRDPAFGISQLATIGWTSTSTARSNPEPALAVCRTLRDLLARWSGQNPPPEDPTSPIVYLDQVPADVVATLESLAVVASESLQHQTLAEVVHTQAVLLPELPPALRAQMEDGVLRSLSALGEHVLTADLDTALGMLVDALTSAGCTSAAAAVREARDALRKSIGHLSSRSTRVPNAR